VELKQCRNMKQEYRKYIDSLTDEKIVQAILDRNKEITCLYLYKKCYPIFESAHRKYYTDCENPTELINEIYVYILTPN